MSEREFATYSVNATQTQLDGPDNHTGRIRHSNHDAGCALPAGRFTQAVREDKGFYIPEIVTEEAYRASTSMFTAALGHAKNLKEAQRLLGEVQDLMPTLEGGAARTNIEGKLREASERLVKHGCRHTNLFLVYFDLKGRIDATADRQ